MSEEIGNVLVPKPETEDAAYCLGVADWREHFYILPVTEDQWDRFERQRLWHKIDEACGSIIDRYEEEWILPEDLPRLEAVLADFRSGTPNLEQQDIEFLDELAAQTRRATSLQAPVIFLLH